MLFRAPLSAASGSSPTPPSPSVKRAAGGKVLFTRIGETSLVSASHVVGMEFELDNIERYAVTLYNGINKVEDYFNSHGEGLHHSTRAGQADLGHQGYDTGALLRSLDTSAARIRRLRSLFRSQDDIHEAFLVSRPQQRVEWQVQVAKSNKSKRAIGHIIIGIILAVTAFCAGYLIYSEVASIKDRVDGLEELTSDTGETFLNIGATEDEIGHLFNLSLHALNDRYKGSTAVFSALNAADAIDRRVRMLEDTLTAAADGRLAASALLHLDFANATHSVALTAAKYHMAPVSKFMTDWLQFPTSWIHTQRGFHLYIQVPLTDLNTQMAIYQFHPLPIPLGKGVHLTVNPGGYSYLAIDPLNKFYRALTAADLQQCRRTGTFFTCDFAGVARKTSAPSNGIDSERCLYDLFAMRISDALRSCPSHLSTKVAALTPTSPHSFASYTTEHTRARVSCRGEKDALRFLPLQDISVISLPPSCTAETDDFVFVSGDSVFKRSDSSWAVEYDWPADPGTWFAEFDDEEMQAFLDRASALANQTEMLHTQTIRHNDLVKEIAARDGWSGNAPAAVGIATIVLLASLGLLLAAVALLWRKLLAKERALNNRIDMVLLNAAHAAPAAAPPAVPLSVTFNSQKDRLEWR